MNSFEVKTKLQGTFEYILVTDDELNDAEKFLSRGMFILQKKFYSIQFIIVKFILQHSNNSALTILMILKHWF